MFKTRISMKCTKEQYTIHLQEELEKRGYAPSKDSFNFWTCPENEYITNYYERDGELGNLPYQDIRSESRQYIGEFNAPLFLAIASRTGTGSIGEWITPNSKSKLVNFTKGKEYQVIELFDEGSIVFDDSSNYHRLTRDFLELHFRTLTVKELKKKFAPEKENNKSTSLKAGSYITVEKDESKNQFICILKEDLGEHDDELSVLVRMQKDGGIILDYREDVRGITVRKSTPEEIELLDGALESIGLKFNKKTLVMEKVKELEKVYNVLKTDVKKIHDVACSTWKTKIKDWVLGVDDPFEDYIRLSEDQIESMYSAANEEQTRVLDKVFASFDLKRNENAMKSNINPVEASTSLQDISQILFGNPYTIELGTLFSSCVDRPDLNRRSIYVTPSVEVIIHTSKTGRGTLLEFKKKS